jgi:glycosyltransferase involved in cell wall biosynthesis
MRIVYLHQYFNTPAMPGSTRSYELARRLAARGHEVHVVTAWCTDDGRRGWSTTQEAGITVHWYPVPYSNRMSFWRRVLAFVRFALAASRRGTALGGNVVYATSTPLSIGIPAIYISRRKKIPMVFEVRDMWPDVPVALGVLRSPLLIWVARRLEMIAYRSAVHIIALAPGMKADIIEKGIRGDKITVIPNGCDPDSATRTASEPDPRCEHEWLRDRKLVLYAGTIGRANGVDYLIEVAAALLSTSPEIRVVIIGDGGDAERVRRRAMEAGVLGRNLYLHKPLPKQLLRGWLRAADLHVALMRGPYSYTKDAVNNKFFDALTFGKPIANNFAGWQASIAEGAGIGVVLDPANPVQAAHEIKRVLDDGEWLAAVPARAFALANGEFHYSLHAERLEQVLRSA